jgi:hypothetical protein
MLIEILERAIANLASYRAGPEYKEYSEDILKIIKDLEKLRRKIKFP